MQLVTQRAILNMFVQDLNTGLTMCRLLKYFMVGFVLGQAVHLSLAGKRTLSFISLFRYSALSSLAASRMQIKFIINRPPIEEEQGDFCTESKVRCEGPHHLFGALSRRGLKPIKLEYDPPH